MHPHSHRIVPAVFHSASNIRTISRRTVRQHFGISTTTSWSTNCQRCLLSQQLRPNLQTTVRPPSLGGLDSLGAATRYFHSSLECASRRRNSSLENKFMVPAGWNKYGGYKYFDNDNGFGDNPGKSSRSYSKVLMWSGMVVGAGTLYYVSHLETVPLSGRRRFIDINPQTEAALAKQAYNQIMAQVGPALLPAWHPYSQLVRRVASRLIKVSGMNDLNWEVHVVDSPQRNAFVLPGGKIFVFTGLLPIVQNEDGLAVVLGHEIAHQVARHTAEKLSFMKILMLAGLGISFLFDTSFFVSRAILDLGFEKPFSRKCESEADQLGLILLARACYNPSEAPKVWDRMAKADRNAPPEFLSTHPSPLRRMKDLEKWQPEAEKERRERCGETDGWMRDFLGMSRKRGPIDEAEVWDGQKDPWYHRRAKW